MSAGTAVWCGDVCAVRRTLPVVMLLSDVMVFLRLDSRVCVSVRVRVRVCIPPPPPPPLSLLSAPPAYAPCRPSDLTAHLRLCELGSLCVRRSRLRLQHLGQFMALQVCLS